MPQFKNQYRPLIFLGFVLLLLGIKVFFLRGSFQTVLEQEQSVKHTLTVMAELEQAIAACKDAGSGIRGYLLTGKDEYLAPYTQGASAARTHIRKVIELTADNPVQQDASREIEKSFERYFAKIDELRQGFKSRNFDATKMNGTLAEAKTIIDMIRVQANEMRQREDALLQLRGETSEQGKEIFFLTLYLSNFLLAGVLIFAFVQISKNMAKGLQETAQKDKESQRRGIISSFAKSVAGDHGLESAGTNILKELAKNFKVVAGKIYVLDHGAIREVSSYGVDADSGNKNFAKSGLISTAIDRGEFWELNDIPEDYWSLSSGFGSMKPQVVSFFPFTFQGEKIGLIELATSETFKKDDIHLINTLSETVGIGMNAALARNQLQILLEKTQQQSAELQAQQEELRSSNEELEQQARALESQQQALNIKNKELETTQGQLELRAQDLERSTQYKSEFLAKMSHELRTPLNGLLILSTLLVENKEKNLTDQQRKFAQSIRSAGNDLLMLINDILDLSKIEARKLTIIPEAFALGDLFSSMKTTFDPQVSAKSLSFKTDLTENLKSLNMFTDRQRLEQILRNFISNAIKFTHEGSITLKGELSGNGKTINLSVTDTGIGVPAHKQQLIFEAFEQADGSVSRQFGGTGLGLTISRELSGLLGGSISLTSKENAGSTFTISIPVKLPSASGAEVREEENVAMLAPRRAAPTPVKKDDNSSAVIEQASKAVEGLTDEKSILVVEDDDNFRKAVVEAIRSYGFAAIEAADGEVALGILKLHVPSAILLDIKLPGISGLGILEMIKQMPHLRHIPVHMISGLEYQQNALRMGALGYLTKPVTIDKVRAAIDRIEKLVSSQVRRVLLIEDDKVQSMAVSELIAGDDIEVVPAKSGKEAVELLNSSGFDCIILDLVLPDVSGFDLLAELKKLDISLPPIVIYTGKDLTPTEDSYLRKFSESIIIKGARSPERLLDEVNLFLHRVESLLPESTRELLTTLRSQEKTFEGKKVLIVDDDIRNIFALTAALEAKGLEVEVARDGLEALSVLDKKLGIDLVVMDIMMPKMDGFEAMRQIRKNPDARIKNVPIIALTAKAMREDHEKCIEAGANDYLPKPVNLDNLTTILKVWLAPKGLFN